MAVKKMMDPPIIKLCNVCKQFGSIVALNEVNLVIEPGIYGLLGPNGAGKTTLMRIIATVMDPTSGLVEVGSFSLPKDKEQLRERLGYLPQEFSLYRRMSGRNFLNYIAVLRGIIDKKERKFQVDRMIELVHLKAVAHRQIRTYSGGMRQRLGIAQALLGDPQVLIVDEPTVGLDPEERIRFRNILGELARERVILLSTHVVADIAGSCRNLAVLKKGRVVYQGSVDALIQQAENKVWSVDITEREYPFFDEHYRVVHSHLTPDGLRIRIVSEINPKNRGQIEPPLLEDAYVYLMGGEEN